MLNYKLRAHHGLCIQFFEGKGYSDNFVDNMNTIVDEIKNNINIQVVSSKDVVCEHCPNLENDVCISQDKVSEMDKKVMSICGFKENQEMSSKDFLNKVYEKIISANRLKDICSTCEWYYICGKK